MCQEAIAHDNANSRRGDRGTVLQIAISSLIKELEIVLTSSVHDSIKIERISIMFSSFNYLDLGVELEDSVNSLRARVVTLKNNISEEGDR